MDHPIMICLVLDFEGMYLYQIFRHHSEKHKAREVFRYGCQMDMMNVIASGANGTADEGLLGPVTVGCRIGDLYPPGN